MLQTITQCAVGGYDNNLTYLVSDTTQRYTVIVDPAGDTKVVLETVRAEGHTLKAIWLTHTHSDHTEGIATVRSHYPELPIYVYHTAAPALREQYNKICELHDGSVVTLGALGFSVLHTPGHSPDSVCFFLPASDSEPPYLLSGDTLFVGGCGRTTPEHVADLYESLQKLKRLPGRTIMYPGHDYGETPASTIAHEMEHNQFLLAADLANFTQLRLPS